MQVHGGQLSLTFLYTPWVDKHAGKNRINLLSAVRKISLKEGGHVLAKKYIDTLKHSSHSYDEGFYGLFYGPHNMGK